MSEEALAFYRALELEVQGALADLTVVPPRKSRPSSLIRQRLEERLQNQREILQRLEQGQIQSEQALKLIVEEQAKQANQPGVPGDYLARMQESLKKLSLKAPESSSPGSAPESATPGSESEPAEGPADD